MTEKIDFDCPVPMSQRPAQEYKIFKESWGIEWTTKPIKEYIKNVMGLFISFFSISFFLADQSTYGLLSQIKITKYSLFFSSVVLFFLFSRLYLSWEYIYSRLMKSTVSYEESGWYDGRVFCCFEFFNSNLL
jgi:hypothetical protein